ncbi:hypothetical protein RE628_13190 [Paenibacillus sp. D2_2]|uniref:hypothetical protein n=1 Tax=Paenibacillus sp. D2_2 TaxID=3073092 RepID=UPI002815ADE6|nr:hypothetical protein [Paenibacillus sp. D2_2]WMT43132.1 hypothetical protein RE628_13190 [Paenibacillus sp. D2_2]
MSIRLWYTFLSFVALILLSAAVYSVIQTRTSFKELVLNQMHEFDSVSEMRVSKNFNKPDEQELKITDQATIKRIFNSLSDLKLLKNSMKTFSDDEYEIRFHGRTSSFTVTYYRPDHIRIMNGSSNHKRYSWEYKIVNHFDSNVIEDLFKG